jgi:U3 small nucleolar RNA-associated protein 22
MGPCPTKRRKLEHGESFPDGSDSEGNSPREQAVGNTSEEPPAPLKQTRTKRAQDDDDAALYAGGLYKSSFFKLQVDELLREVKPNYEKRFSGVKEVLHKLKGLIESIEERDALSVS